MFMISFSFEILHATISCPSPSTPLNKLNAKPYSTIKPPKKEPAELEATLHQRREPSPELARFSALVTRPPKQKTPSTSKSIRLRIKGFKVIRLDD